MPMQYRTVSYIVCHAKRLSANNRFTELLTWRWPNKDCRMPPGDNPSRETPSILQCTLLGKYICESQNHSDIMKLNNLEIKYFEIPL